VIPAAAIGSSSAIGADTLSGLRPRRKTFVVRPGVEDFMKPGWMEQRATARARLGVGEQDIVVALIARFHPQKGQGRFVAALKLLHDAGVPVRGLLVGGTAHGQNAGYEPLVMRQIADSGLADCVMHIDHVSEPWGYLLAADIYVNARERENLSLGILEAACAGRAIIAPATGGTPEILEDETSGLLIATPDPHSLAAAIRRLVEDRQLRGRLGSGARSLYERRFTVARMVRELEDAIVGLADGGAGSPL
jgi:glycosyltransferase involved in cell wall biosynthesis